MNIIASTRQYPSEYFERMILSPILQWTDWITNKTNFNLVRFGDGEILCMMGEQGQNCDQHPYSPELGEKLNRSFDFFLQDNNTFFGEWGDQPGSFGTPQNISPITEQPGKRVFEFQKEKIGNHKLKLANFEILQSNTLFPEKKAFFKSIKESKRKKIFIGHDRLIPVNNFLNITKYIQIPQFNSFSEYDKIQLDLIKEIEDDSIFLFAAGMPTECYMHTLVDINSKITCLDIGSGLDCMCCGYTREGQLPAEVIQDFYKEML